MNRAMRRAVVSTRRTFDRRVRRIDLDTYLHCTKGVKRVRKYEKLQEARQIIRALGSA